jgi:septal ring factor EnvC (AmiA/AmiB activator)
MFYVLQHIFFCLLAAATLGALLAWWFFGRGFKTKFADLESDWSGRLTGLQSDNDKLVTQWKEAEGTLGSWKHKFGSLEADHTRLQADFSGVSARLPILETAVAGWTAKAATWDSDRSKLHADLRACADARSALEVQIAEWGTRAKAWDTERATLRANLNKAVSDDAADDAAYEKTITSLRADLAGLQLKLKNAEVAANEWQAKHATMETQYKRAISDDAADDAAYEKTISALRAEIASLQASAKKAADDDTIEDANFRSTIEGLRAEVAGLQAKLKREQEADRADDAAYEKTIATLRGDVSSLQAQIKREQAADQTEDANYERVITQLRGEIANLKAAAKRAADDDTIEDANFRNTIEGLRAEVTGLQAKLKREQEADRADDARYERELAAARARIQALEAQLAAPPPAMAMAAAAGVASAGAATALADDGRLTSITRRFESFVLRTQREGWGDIERIEGIGPVYGQKLRSGGIAWVKDLLEEGSAPAGRLRIAEETGIKRELILKWVNAADLLRVPGTTPDWAELLEASGVDTVKELRGRIPENLHKKMTETNPVGNYARTVPDVETVRGWVDAAKRIEPKVTH